MFVVRLTRADDLFEGNEPVLSVRITGADDIAWFRVALQRALNTWDDAPAEIKELGDWAIYGQLLQNYRNSPPAATSGMRKLHEQFKQDLDK